MNSEEGVKKQLFILNFQLNNHSSFCRSKLHRIIESENNFEILNDSC